MRLEITATATNDAQRQTATSSLAVQLATGPCIRVVEIGDKPAGAIESMAFSPDGKLALIGGGAGKTDGPGGTPGGPGGPPGGPGGQAEEKNAIQVWNLERAEPLAPLVGHTNKVIGIVISADGKTGLSVSLDRDHRDMGLGVGQAQTPIRETGFAGSVAADCNGRRGLVAYPSSAVSPPVVVKVNLENFQPTHAPINSAGLLGTKVEDAVRTMAISVDNKLGLIGGVNGKLFLIDMIKADTKPKALTGHTEAVLSAAFSPAGGRSRRRAAASSKSARFNRAKTMRCACGIPPKRRSNGRAKATRHPWCVWHFHPMENGWHPARSDGEIRVWNVADGKSVATFAGHTGRVFALAFSSDGTKLWSGAADRSLRQWRLP